MELVQGRDGQGVQFSYDLGNDVHIVDGDEEYYRTWEELTPEAQAFLEQLHDVHEGFLQMMAQALIHGKGDMLAMREAIEANAKKMYGTMDQINLREGLLN